MTGAILVLNAGSSSLKFALYPDTKGDPLPMLRGKISGIGTRACFSAEGGDGRTLELAEFMRPASLAGHDTLIPALLDWVREHRGGVALVAAGHRVVHGGRLNAGPACVTNAVLSDLDTLVPLAPLHQPHNLAAIRIVAAAAPDLPQVACFDTSFHRTQGRLAQLFALPRELSDEGILRYGFHGLSYAYIADILPPHLGARAEGRVIVAHLGNGASMCAMRNRQSVATSMGFTALDGLMMGTRCGAIDAGVLLYLLREKGMDVGELSRLLYERSGLKGVSGLSGDMAVLEVSAAPEAREAIDLFCHRAAGELAALAAALGGLDALVFTAGIGENSALVRGLICDRLDWMGIALDQGANATNATRISATDTSIDVLIVPTDEEAVIFRETRDLISAAGSRRGSAARRDREPGMTTSSSTPPDVPPLLDATDQDVERVAVGHGTFIERP